MNTQIELKSSFIDTPIGDMLVVSDTKGLYFLEFTDWKGFETKLRQLSIKTKTIITPGVLPPIKSIENELKNYFLKKTKIFKTPIHFWGTDFQNNAWKELFSIPFGQTRSYQLQAKNIGKPKAYRAVANANGTNPMAIIIPCHRIIRNSGDIGGYGGGEMRKKWLLEFEKNTEI